VRAFVCDAASVPLALVLATLVLVQTLLLLVPWLAVRTTFHGPPEPVFNLEHARTARAARWRIDYPGSVGLGVLGALWIGHGHNIVIAVYLALITRIVVFQATNARRSVPALSWAFPWLLAPVLAWASVLLAAFYLSRDLSWLGWVVGGLQAFVAPTLVLGFLAIMLRPVVVAAKRLWLSRRLQGRWVTSAGGWTVCDARPDQDGVSLAFTAAGGPLPVPRGDPPDFLVWVTYDRDWQPPEGSQRPLRLADYPGLGPIKAAMFAATYQGIRAARARLDGELVVVIEEVRIGGDDFFQFITSLLPGGRTRSTSSLPMTPLPGGGGATGRTSLRSSARRESAMASVRLIAAGDTPNGVALSPSGDRVYLANNRVHKLLPFRRTSTVSVVDLEAGREAGRIRVGRGCIAVAVHPSGTQAYAANVGSRLVSILDIPAGREVAQVPAGRGPRALAVSPSGDRLYVANIGSRTVSVLDLATRAAVASVEAGNGPCALALSPSGDRLYVANFKDGSVTIVDPDRLAATTTVTVGSGPGGLALSPSGDRLYIANRWSQTISVMDTGDGTIVGTVCVTTSSQRPPPVSFTTTTLQPEPYGVAVSRDGAHLLVALWEPGTVALIDTVRGRIIDEYDLGGGLHSLGPTEIVADPRADRFYVACAAGAVAIVTL